MEDQLQELNVKRQAYHSNSFVGNHVNTCLKVNPPLILALNKLVSYVVIVNIYHYLIFFSRQTQNIQKVCHKVVEVTEQECPEFVPEAVLIEAKYTQLFTLFGQCHFKFIPSTPMEEPEIAALGKQLT